jgi:hypothetical protein
MKALWIHHPYKDFYHTLTDQKKAELTAAVNAFSDKYMKAGKLKDIFFLYDGRTIGLWDFDSAEEMAIIAMQWPMSTYSEVDYILYADFREAMAMSKKVAAEQEASLSARHGLSEGNILVGTS